MAWKIIFTFVDRKLRTATTEVKLPSASTLSQVTEFGTTFASIVDALSNSKLGAINIQAPTILSSGLGVKSVPSSVADNEEKGVFSFRTSHTSPTKMSIPALKESLVVDGTDLIDTSDSDVSAYITIMINGLTLTDLSTVEPCDIGDEDIYELIDAYERFKKSGKWR